MPDLDRIVVVGASLAGLRAVEALRREGFSGALTLIGDEPQLPYDRPPLSKQFLSGAWDEDRFTLRKPNSYDELDLDIRLGARATALNLDDREVSLEDGARVPYDGLIIATGARPRTLPGQPDLEGIFTLRTLEEAQALRAAFDGRPRVAVVGAGFIGAEVTATARTLDLEVTLVEMLPVPMERALGTEMGGAMADLHRDHDVDLRLGVAVEAMLGDGRVERLRLSDGAEIAADVVVVGVGVRPNTEWLEDSGLTIQDGVLCDATCNAGAPNVYAAGDVCRWRHDLFGEDVRLEHWANAAEQGPAAARNLLLGAEAAEPFAPVPYFWSDQYDVSINYVGHAHAGDEVRVVSGSVADRKFVALYGREGRLVACLTMSNPRAMRDYQKLIGERCAWDDALAHARDQA